jgi:hypothetical protein
MDVLLDALGYQARQPHQEDVSTSSTDALRGVTSERYGRSTAPSFDGIAPWSANLSYP